MLVVEYKGNASREQHKIKDPFCFAWPGRRQPSVFLTKVIQVKYKKHTLYFFDDDLTLTIQSFDKKSLPVKTIPCTFAAQIFKYFTK